MTKVASVTISAVLLAGLAAAGAAEAKERRPAHPTRVHVVDWRTPLPVPPCAPEVYPFAPSACLRGGYIAFDGKTYFAPRYGYRAQRYFDGW